MSNIKLQLFFCVNLLFSISSFSQWNQTAGPEGGYTGDIIQVDNTLLMTSSEGVNRSTDNGTSWELSNTGLPELIRVMRMTLDGNNIYISLDKHGVYRSVDKGNTWSPANFGAETQTFRIILAKDGEIYAGTSSSGLVYYSPDNGASWSIRSNGVSGNQLNGFVSFNSKIYVGTAGGLFENEGNTVIWNPIDIPGLSPNGIRSLTAHNGVFYVASDGQMFTSTDNLATWVLTPLANGVSITNMVSYEGTVYANTSRGYYYTNDDGANWVSVQNINTEHFINDILVSNGKIILTTTGGNFESFDNGVSWTFNSTGIRGQLIGSFASNGTHLYAGTRGNGIFRSADNGGSWTEINTGLDAQNSHTINEMIALDNTIYAATSGGLYISNNNGDSWVLKLDPGVNKSTGTLSYSNGIFATSVTGLGVYISSNLGETWTLTSTEGFNLNSDYRSLLIHEQNIFTSNVSGELFLSTNLGQSWTDISISDEYFFINDIEYVNDTLYVATHLDLWTSTDLGQNWQPFLTSDSSSLQDLKDIIVGDEIVYAATATGIQICQSGGDSWYPVNEGMGAAYTTSILQKDGLLFTGPAALSVWSRPISEIEFPISDNDNDGVADVDDLCPNTITGVTVNNTGCDLIAPDAIRVYTRTPSCPDVNNGEIEITTSLSGYSFDIELVGEGKDTSFMAVNLGGGFIIDDLAPGTYEVTISIPAVFYEQTYGLTINELNGISGKLESADVKSLSAKYIVSGSSEYTVTLNGVQKSYLFDSNIDNTIVVHGLKMSNKVLIAGKNDCQGKFSDILSFEEDIRVFPTETSGLLSVLGRLESAEIHIYSISGQLMSTEKLETRTDNSIQLDGYTSGLYILHVKTKESTKIFKVIKK